MTFLVTGAGGQLGRRVVELLLEANAGKVVAATRDPARIADLAAKGAETRRADFDDPASLDSAFAGVERLLLISTDAIQAPGVRLAQHRAAVAAAERAGVAHVIYTSAPSPCPAPDNPLIDSHFWTEQALAATNLAWTILRNNIYAEILLRSLSRAVETGQLVTATGNGGRNYVTREDCARTAAAALLRADDGRRILDVNGPAPVTQAEIAAIASELTGRPVTHVSVSADELRTALVAAGLAQPMAVGLASFDVDAAEGRHAINAPTVKALTGREPTSVRAFLTANRDALRPAG